MENAVYSFQLQGAPVSCQRYGNGHINVTYLVITDIGHWYILQRINHTVFKDVPQLMRNIAYVTGHLQKKDANPRHVLTLIPTLGGDTYLLDGEGFYWRMYDFITDSVCLDRVESAEDFFQSAVAFGTFQNQLADCDASKLGETIAHFHDTPVRYDALEAAIAADICGRTKDVQREIAFAMVHREEAAMMQTMLKNGELPLRVTHNDTKLNNVMLDKATRTPLCVIDLDTVMPGLVANDFGDSIRFGASTAAEDEQDLSKVEMSLDLYAVYVKGFLLACGQRLTKTEIDTLPLGAKMMTLECGVRFLADYLAGDTYFATHRPGHNLDRCRTQFKLVENMESKWESMQAILREAQE